MPEVAFDVERNHPKTFAMEAAASALLTAAREITASSVTPEIRERISTEETEADFINRNMIHLSVMGIANVAGEARDIGVPMIMEALGTSVGEAIAAQAGSVLHFSTFWTSLLETLSGHGIIVAQVPGSMSDFIPGEAPIPDDEGGE